MYQWNTSSIHDTFRIQSPSNIKTILAKVIIDDSDAYSYKSEQTLIGRVSGSAISSSISGSGEWAIGFVRVPKQNSAQVFFRIGYAQNEVFKIYSPTFPLFDGNVYNIMVRRNAPDINYEYTASVDLVPCRYDLYVQRNEFGNQAVHLTSSKISYEASTNQLFDVSSTGSYVMIGGWFADLNGQGFTGAMDKIQLWFDPIEDSNFEDYVNSINSYSFSGSNLPGHSLLFRMHTDYPFDMRQISSGSPIPSGFNGLIGTSSNWIGSWRNGNYFYALNSSEKQNTIFGIDNAVSLDLMVNSDAQAGSQILAHDSMSCAYSQSVYPFQFKVIDYPSTLPTANYGPNKFRNEKVVQTSQSVASRFDDQLRSTYSPRNSTSPDSTQVGFFADPQDFKNKDIVRFFGNYNLMDAIGGPENQFSGSYDSLRNLRSIYAQTKNEYSGSRTLFNELITLYKLYFNRSIFEAIKNLVPARTNALVGVVIEPTLLERPKYPSKPVVSEVNSGSVFYYEATASHYFRDSNTDLVRMTQSLDYAEFNIDPSIVSQFDTSSLPHNLTVDLNESYINLPNAIYPRNYLPNGTYISDVMDKYQLGHFGSYGNFLQLIQGDLTNGRIPFDMTRDTHPIESGSLYLLKRWKRYSIYAKSSSWNRTDNPVDNLYCTNSVYLYDYVTVTSDFFNSIAYTASVVDGTPGNPGSEFGLGYTWTHYPNTFKNSPNAVTNNYLLTGEFNGLRWIFGHPVILIDDGEYFEIVGGYPRNHFTHKRDLFSLYSLVTYGLQDGVVTSGLYLRNQQRIDTTIGQDGLEDGSSPVQTVQVGNLNLVQSKNVINQ
jgi:hypothetical protein